jgi:hypothetical protein
MRSAAPESAEVHPLHAGVVPYGACHVMTALREL